MRERSKINKDSFDLLYEEAAKDSADYIRKYIDEAIITDGGWWDVAANKIEVDGGIGPATLNAIQNISLDRVRAYRVLRFANIVIDKPNQEKFWLGWFRRATEV